jgi:hypothetical protein
LFQRCGKCTSLSSILFLQKQKQKQKQKQNRGREAIDTVEPTNGMELRTRLAFYRSLCGGLQNFFEDPGAKPQTSSKAPSAPGIRSPAAAGGRFNKGPAKRKSVTPVVGGWVRVRKRDGVRFIFSIFFESCF